MSSISIVYNGVCAKDGTDYYHMRSMVEFLRELTHKFSYARYYGGYLEPQDVGYSFAHEMPLAIPNLELCLVRGNSASTGTIAFIRNYIWMLRRLWSFIQGSDYLLVFLPSFLSAVAASLALALRKNLGVYIGGNWGEETKHRKKNLIRTLAYPINRFLIDPVTLWVVMHARFAITPGYDLYHKLAELKCNVRLPVPLVNVTRADVLERQDTCQDLETRILFVGALRYTKGVQELLEAFVDLKRHQAIDANVKLWFVGSGEAEIALRRRAEELQVTGDVRFWGHIANGPPLYQVYRQSDIFVLPAYSEGFPRVLYEAMTFGLPIITTSVGGIPFLLHHLSEAYLVEPRDTAGICAALQVVLADTGLRKQLIKNSRALMLDVIFKRMETEINLANQVRQQFDPCSPVTDCHEQ